MHLPHHPIDHYVESWGPSHERSIALLEVHKVYWELVVLLFVGSEEVVCAVARVEDSEGVFVSELDSKESRV